MIVAKRLFIFKDKEVICQRYRPILEYSVLGNPQQQIGDLTQTKLEGF